MRLHPTHPPSSLLYDASSPSAGAVYYGENNDAIRRGRGQTQEPDFEGNLADITDQYQGRQRSIQFTGTLISSIHVCLTHCS